MSDFIRPRVDGACVFFTVAAQARGRDTFVRHIGALRAAVAATRAERPFRIDAWVVLPDHLHCVWTLPEGDSDYSVRWGAIKARFTRAVLAEVDAGGEPICRPGFSPAPPVVTRGRFAGLKPGLRANKRERPVWQRRFWEHHIRDEEDFAAHVRYCWINPVKHGLVESPADWPYSSYHRDGRGSFIP